MDMNIQRKDIFVESIFDVEVPDVDTDGIYAFFMEAKKNHGGISRSNYGGWQFDMKTDMCPAYDDLLQKLDMAANHIVKNVFKMDLEVFVCNSWLNHSLKGGMNSIHTHPGALLSGAFYIKTNDKTGDINFIRESAHAIENTLHYLNQDYIRQQRDKLWMTNHTRPPKQNHAYMFSPWLMHEVMENMTNDDRLVAGFNVRPVFKEDRVTAVINK